METAFAREVELTDGSTVWDVVVNDEYSIPVANQADAEALAEQIRRYAI